MRKGILLLKQVFLLLTTVLLSTVSMSAAQFVVKSDGANPYTVKVTVTPVSLAVPAACPNGYNYNVNYVYEVAYSGNIPANTSLYTLQANFTCGKDNLGAYTLPLKLGGATKTGSGVTTNNPYRTTKDCASATILTAGCIAGITTLTIDGPQLASRQISLPTDSKPLPVTLVSFDARNTSDGVFLTWTTANEEKGDQYFMERSSDAVNWTTVTVVNSAAKSNYQYTDNAPQSGSNYYRLRNVDAQGVVTYSRILGVKIDDLTAEISVSPNPVSGEKIRVSGIQTPADWHYTLTNATSQLVAQVPLTSPEIALPQLPTGLYFIRFTNSKTNESKVLKLVRE